MKKAMKKGSYSAKPAMDAKMKPAAKKGAEKMAMMAKKKK